MKEKISGLSIKLITSVLLLSVLLCAAISYMGYREFTTVLEDEYNRSAYEIAETAKSYLDPDRLEHYLETGEIDAAYLEIQDRLDALVVSTNSYLIYVTRLSNDYTTSTYIFDAVHPDSGFIRYALGYTAQDMDPAYQDEVEQIMTTGERSAVYFYSYTQASGAHTTAGIPVKDSAGEIVAFLGVEKAMTALENARQTYVWNVMGITVLAVVLFLVVYIGFLRREVVSPILTIAGEARRFAEDNVARLDLLEQIRKKDEIGTLARAIGRMETDIVQYVENLTAVTAEKERIGTELNVATGGHAAPDLSALPGAGRVRHRRHHDPRQRGGRRLLRLLPGGPGPSGGGHRRCVGEGRAGGAVHGDRQDPHQEPHADRHGA